MKDVGEIFMSGPWITEVEEKLVLDALRSGWYGRNQYYYCERLERAFAEYHNRRFALMTPNCTSAIHLLLAGMGIGPGDEVIVPECTWIASAAPISYCGATPVFADVDKGHWCVTPETIRENVTTKTKAIIAVDLYGNMPDWDQLTALGKELGLPVVEDSAEALGSQYRSRRAGSFGVGSVFSFHRTKTLTTGEGGMLLIDDETLYERCRLLRDHGRPAFSYLNEVVGFKYMPFNVQAALGYGQFTRIEELIAKKRWILKMYRTILGKVPGFHLNAEPEHVINGAWAVGLVFDEELGLNAVEVMNRLSKAGLPARRFFVPLSSLPAYSQYKLRYQGKNPVAKSLGDRGINLPAALNITEDQIEHYCENVLNITSSLRKSA